MWLTSTSDLQHQWQITLHVFWGIKLLLLIFHFPFVFSNQPAEPQHLDEFIDDTRGPLTSALRWIFIFWFKFCQLSNETARPHKGLGTSKEPNLRPPPPSDEHLRPRCRGVRQTSILGEILNYAGSWCGGETLFRPERCKIRRGVSVIAVLNFRQWHRLSILAQIINMKCGLHVTAPPWEWVFSALDNIKNPRKSTLKPFQISKTYK